MWIKAKNGNVVETDDIEIAKRALAEGHEVLDGDPRAKGSKPGKWDPEAEVDETDADGDDSE